MGAMRVACTQSLSSSGSSRAELEVLLFFIQKSKASVSNKLASRLVHFRKLLPPVPERYAEAQATFMIPIEADVALLKPRPFLPVRAKAARRSARLRHSGG